MDRCECGALSDKVSESGAGVARPGQRGVGNGRAAPESVGGRSRDGDLTESGSSGGARAARGGGGGRARSPGTWGRGPGAGVAGDGVAGRERRR
jgi:hypothetical protein